MNYRKYDITVGALGGKSVYAGGIVGGVNTADGETRIVDCFCTADVSFYAANYVAVGSGIAGYAGGIMSAAVDGIKIAEMVAINNGRGKNEQ